MSPLLALAVAERYGAEQALSDRRFASEPRKLGTRQGLVDKHEPMRHRRKHPAITAGVVVFRPLG